jgi:hypothetical protein
MKSECVDFRLLSPRFYGTVAQNPALAGSALENVPTANLFEGSACWVVQPPVGGAGLFVLFKSSTAVVDGMFVLPAYGGVGRWHRVDANAFANQVHFNSNYVQFGAIVVAAGTLEANAVVLAERSAAVVTQLGIASGYILEADLIMQVVCNTAEGSTVTGGVKLIWDLDGTGTYETEGARYAGFFADDVGGQTIVLRERRAVLFAGLGVAQTPAVRAVGWDAEGTGGYTTFTNGGTGEHPNSLKFQYSWQ